MNLLDCINNIETDWKDILIDLTKDEKSKYIELNEYLHLQYETCKELDNGDLSFRLYVDGEIIKEGIVSKKDKTLEITNNLLFKHNVINEGMDLAEYAEKVKVIYPE